MNPVSSLEAIRKIVPTSEKHEAVISLKIYSETKGLVELEVKWFYRTGAAHSDAEGANKSEPIYSVKHRFTEYEVEGLSGGIEGTMILEAIFSRYRRTFMGRTKKK